MPFLYLVMLFPKFLFFFVFLEYFFKEYFTYFIDELKFLEFFKLE